MKVVIAAAGTAGHINPGIAIADKIKKEEPNSEVIFIGTKMGLERELVPKSGYKLYQIQAYGLGKNIAKNFKTFKGIFEAIKILKQFNPDIVIGAGGYICGPTIIAAKMLKIPTMLHESNAFPGKAVKMLARMTDIILISFEDARNRIKGAKKIVLTGTPIKSNLKELSASKKKNILQELNLKDDKPIALIFGGSQGARKINDAVIELLSENQKLDYQIVLSSGKKQYNALIKQLESKKISIPEGVRIFPYIYNMEEVEQISDILVCRSGAISVAETSAIGKPAIFIPLPNVSNDHQTYNAKVLENVNAAKIIKDEELTGKKLHDIISSIIFDNNTLKTMGKNAKKVAIMNAEDKIYNEIKILLNKM